MNSYFIGVAFVKRGNHCYNGFVSFLLVLLVLSDLQIPSVLNVLFPPFYADLFVLLLRQPADHRVCHNSIQEGV